MYYLRTINARCFDDEYEAAVSVAIDPRDHDRFMVTVHQPGQSVQAELTRDGMESLRAAITDMLGDDA